ncbi:MAG: amidase [Pseudomonadota bacterium]
MSDTAFLSATELAAGIKQKKFSSVELTQLYIDRIEQLDGDINAVVVRIFDRAMADAKAADEALARGEDLGPLHGVPMTIKESYVIEGTPVTFGLEAFRNNIAKKDGLAVSRFRSAGAHFIGKTNVPVNLADFQSYNPVYGVTGNPWNTGRTPGGSSGGSAAALAAGFTGLEAGSDIGGSIRNPAHFCGVFGHKPTWGIVPMQGHELVEGLPDVDLAVCGPLARSAEDLAVALNTMAGPIEREAVGWKLDLPAPDFQSLKELRVAIWPTDEVAPVSNEVADRATSVGETLAKLGATVSDTARPDFDVHKAHVAYQSLLNSVMSAGMSDAEFERARALSEAMDPNDMSDRAVVSRGMVLTHRHWVRYNNERERLRHAWVEFFKDWDILVCPQMALPAFPHDHSQFSQRTVSINGDDQYYFTQLFWAGLITNPYLPSTVFPTGPSPSEGLPIGLQAVSAPYRDYRTIEFTRLLAKEIGGFVPPPALAG